MEALHSQRVPALSPTVNNYMCPHHGTAISLAIVTATAEAIKRGVNKRARKLTLCPHAVAGGQAARPRSF